MATTVANRAGTAVDHEGDRAAVPAREVDTRNVHQRKLAVMGRCSDFGLDKKHGQGFDYLSIGHASDKVRQFCVEEGIDPNISVTDGVLILTLTNVDEPSQEIVSTWPLVPTDKAWAYTTKYALVRTFLIGDTEEGDEAEMANHSAAATTAEVKRVFAPTNAPRPAQGDTASRRPLGDCEQCAELGITASSGRPSAYWPGRNGKPPQCNGKEGDVWLNHVMPQLTGVGGAVQSAADAYDQSEVPF